MKPPSRAFQTAFPGHLVTALVMLLLSAAAFAINAPPYPVTVTQPDGTKLVLRGRGDAFFNWCEDTQGFTVVRNAMKQWVYANLDGEGKLAPTALQVGKVDPRAMGLSKGILPPKTVIESIRARSRPPEQVQGDGADHSDEPPSLVQPSGTVKNLVVLCKFSDHVFGTHTQPQADYDVLFNSVGGHATIAPTGSVKDYFTEASYGQLNLQSTVVVWVTLPQTESYYADGKDGTDGAFPKNAQGMVRDALDLVDPLVNFAQFDQDNDGFIDSITIIHSGYAQEAFGVSGDRIWSHRWSLWQLPGGQWTSADNNGSGTAVKVYDYHTESALWGTSGTQIVRIGVICHETGHFFGLPDLYDTDNSSEGIGSWCLMANSWGFDFTQLHPPHLSAWCKAQLGWLTPTEITSGTFTAPQVETNPTVFKVTNGFPSGEYLLIENRQPVGFESSMPQGGLAIWHIDDKKTTNRSEGYPAQSGWPGNNNHYKIALLQADGLYEMERNLNRGNGGDVYRNGGASAITPATVPSTDRYQDGIVAPTNNSITSIGPSGAMMSFTLNGSGVTPVITSATAVTAPPAVPFTYQIVSTASPTSYNATGLPSGLTVNTASGLISGTPGAVGVFPVNLSATNASGTGTATLTLTIAAVLTLADALDTTGMTWTTGGNSNWSAKTVTTHDGQDAAQSGALGDSQLSYMETTISGSGVLTFWWKVSSESGYDYLRFTVDGVEQSGIAGISGNVDWQQRSVSLGSGSHILRWQYSKDGSVANGSDAGWVDEVMFTAGGVPAPVITSVTTASGVLSQAFSYQITATNSPTSYGASGLPGGLTINTATGQISGAPTVTGTFNVGLSATNATGTGNATLVLTITSSVLTLADAVDAPSLVWTVGGVAGWRSQVTTTHDGQDAGQSGVIGHSQSSHMETAVTGPGTLSFWWKVSSESGYDYLRFTVDGVEQGGVAGISGNVDWVQRSVSVASGTHTLRWTYSKDGSVVDGSDAGWVDQVTYTPAAAVPEIVVEQPAGTGLTDGVSTVGFGSVSTGSVSARTFTIGNLGGVNLTGLGISIDGAHPGDFTVTASPTAPVISGGTTTFTIQFAPSALGARSAVLHLASNDADENPFDITLSGTGVSTPTGGLDFQILSLSATGAAVVDHNALTGDDRGGIAVSSSRVFVTGDDGTSGHVLSDLSGGFSLGRLVDGLCSDIGTGTVYTFAFNGVAHSSGGGSINQLIQLDPVTGALTANIINLSATIPIGSGCGVFSGKGRVVIYNGTAVYDILVPSGVVSNLGAMTRPAWYGSESWAVWGVAEFFSGNVHLAYRSFSSSQILRTRVPDGFTETIATFSNLGDLGNWTVSPSNGRWYFHHEYNSQLGGLSSGETLGYADATFSSGGGGGGFQDDFDPSHEPALWAQFGGTAVANTNAQAAGAGSIGNSLWFGGDGSRFALTAAINTTSGGNVSFLLAVANGSTNVWEMADSGEEVVLEYTTNGTTFTQIGGPYNNTTWETIVVPIPAGAQTATTQFRFRQLSNSGAEFDHWAIDNVQIGGPVSAGPEIAVEQPAGTVLTDGVASINFGSVAGGFSSSLTFTIGNSGSGSLTGLGITIEGTNPGDFTVMASPAAPVSPGGTTTFTVQFAPSALGARTAVLHLASNDADENPFDISLSGTGVSAPSGGLDFQILSLATTGALVVDHNSITGDDRGGIAVSSSRVFVTGDNATSSHALGDLTGGVSIGRIADGLCSDIGTGTVYTLAYNGVAFPSGGASSINQLIQLDPATGALTGNIINLSSAISMGGDCGVFSGKGRVVIYSGTGVHDILVPSGIVSNLGAMTRPAWFYTESWAVWGVAEYFSGSLHLAYRSSAGPQIVRTRVPDGVTTTIATFSDLGDLANFTVSPSNNRWYFHHEGSSQFGGASETLGYADATFSSSGGGGFQDDFDPSYDPALWAQFGGAPAANTNGQAAGAGSTGNSLWFGGDGSRFALTTAINTTSGGSVSFRLAVASGSSSTWETADPGEEVVLEYTTNGTTFTQIGGPYNNTTWQSIMVPIPAGAQTAATQFRFRQLSNSGVTYDHWAIDDVQIGGSVAGTPEIAVEQPVGTGLTDDVSTTDFGPVVTGANNTRTFTIYNTGSGSLTGLGITIDGAHPGDFTVTASPTPPVSPGGTTTFTVRFAPSALGTRTAVLHLASSDADENPFDVSLSGTGIVSAGSIALFANPANVDTAAGGEVANMQVSLQNLGFAVVQFTGTAAADWNNAFSSDVVIIPELENGSLTLTTQANTAINAHLAAGKGLIVMGVDTSYEEQLLNTLRGWSLVDSGYTTSGGIPKVSGVVGFTNSPSPLNALNATYLVTSASLPAGAQPVYQIGSDTAVFVAGPVGFVAYDWYAGPDPGWDNVLRDTITAVRSGGGPSAPELAVEQPAGAGLADGASTTDFGPVLNGGNTTRVFTIRNSGTTSLTGLGITIDGAHPGDFTVTVSPAAPVSPAGTTTFTVRFAPSALGARGAVLHLASNDADENPFDITLTGTGINQLQSWRQLHFGTTSNTGNAADSFDYDKDGLSNLLEWACNLNPTTSSSVPATIVRNGANLEFTYYRSVSAVSAGALFSVEWSGTLAAGTWGTSGVTENILSDNGTVQQVRATVSAGASGRRFVHLRVTAP